LASCIPAQHWMPSSKLLVIHRGTSTRRSKSTISTRTGNCRQLSATETQTLRSSKYTNRKPHWKLCAHWHWPLSVRDCSQCWNTHTGMKTFFRFLYTCCDSRNILRIMFTILTFAISIVDILTFRHFDFDIVTVVIFIVDILTVYRNFLALFTETFYI